MQDKNTPTHPYEDETKQAIDVIERQLDIVAMNIEQAIRELTDGGRLQRMYQYSVLLEDIIMSLAAKVYPQDDEDWAIDNLIGPARGVLSAVDDDAHDDMDHMVFEHSQSQADDLVNKAIPDSK